MNRKITLGSLFDGIGGFPLSGAMCGVEPVWASEIEPFPIAVTMNRFPNMKHLGSVTDIKGDQIEPVDIITFGSPCQDLSVAGKQAGIHEGARSNLFFEAVRIIKEMREHDRSTGRTGFDVRPRFAVWENVPGAFSSGKGKDFQAVLQTLCKISDPDVSIPLSDGGWSKSGCVVGKGYSVAWRVYDAQYWGVPQRRKRIYLVADFASERAGEILFEQESVRGHSEASGTAREGIASDAEGSAGRGCEPASVIPINTMVATRGKKLGRGTGFGIGEEDEPQFTISAAHAHAVGYVISENSAYGFDAYQHHNWRQSDNFGPLTTAGGAIRGDTPLIVSEVTYSLQGNVIDRNAGQNGIGVREGVSHTVNAVDRHGIVYPNIARTLTAEHDASPCVDRGQNMVIYDCRGNGVGGVSPTLTGDHQNRVTDYTAVACYQRVVGGTVHG